MDTLYEKYPSFHDYWLDNSVVQRYGQAFCNYYNITCPDIFYANTIVEAVTRIEQHPHYNKLL